MASFSKDFSFNEEEELIDVLATDFEKNWAGRQAYQIFDGRTMQSFDIFGNIREAFMKRRPFRSRYAIELYFDSALETQLRIAWKILKNHKFEPIESRPHITLTTSPVAQRSKLEKILKTLVLNQGFLSISFSSIGPLKKAGSPTQSTPLLQFHSKLCEAMTKEGIKIGENYRPGTWVPFCIVAEKVLESRMGDAETALRTFNLPLSGYAVEIGLLEVSPTPETYLLREEEATLLFRKPITPIDAMLYRFSVPKEIAESETYFPGLAQGGSVDIEVWDPEGKICDMVLTRYMNYTYHIGADWKEPTKPMRLVAGDVILFYKLKREGVFVFPYEYMIRFEKSDERGDSKDGFDGASSRKSVAVQDDSDICIM